MMHDLLLMVGFFYFDVFVLCLVVMAMRGWFFLVFWGRVPKGVVEFFLELLRILGKFCGYRYLFAQKSAEF
jgi:hypothetical protein